MKKLLVLGLAIGAVGAVAQGKTPPVMPTQGPGLQRWQIPAEIPRSLKQALRAVGRIRFSGTRVIESKVGPNRQRHTEYVITDGPRSRIEFPSGAPLHGQVVIETAAERRQFLPQSNQVMVFPPRRQEAFGRIAQMAARRNIVLAESPGGSVAGLATQLVAISDRSGNVLQKLWIESDSGMILKREMYDRTGSVSASFEFTQVDLHPTIRPSDFSMPKDARVVTVDDLLARMVMRGGFRSVRLPPDSPYKLEGARIQKIAQQDVLVQQYAGKGHRVTLYQLKSAVDPQRLGRLERADLQIYSWQSSGASFVLVGDLPEAELTDLGHRLGG